MLTFVRVLPQAVDAVLRDHEGGRRHARGEHRRQQQHRPRAQQLHQPAAEPRAGNAANRLRNAYSWTGGSVGSAADITQQVVHQPNYFHMLRSSPSCDGNIERQLHRCIDAACTLMVGQDAHPGAPAQGLQAARTL